MSLIVDPIALVTEGTPGALLIHVTEAREAETLSDLLGHLRALSGGRGFALAALAVTDWNADLSPWAAPPTFGRVPFAGQAGRTLDALLSSALPGLDARLGRPLPRCIGGYSLAGLFALWACCECGAFDAAMAASPSVWFPGWDDYAGARPFRARMAYLSLGTREPRTRNPRMATVGDAIQRQQARFEAGGIPSELEWNEGNHFTDPVLRTARGFAWALERLAPCPPAAPSL